MQEAGHFDALRRALGWPSRPPPPALAGHADAFRRSWGWPSAAGGAPEPEPEPPPGPGSAGRRRPKPARKMTPKDDPLVALLLALLADED